jgi:hypothetical protein
VPAQQKRKEFTLYLLFCLNLLHQETGAMLSLFSITILTITQRRKKTEWHSMVQNKGDRTSRHQDKDNEAINSHQQGRQNQMPPSVSHVSNSFPCVALVQSSCIISCYGFFSQHCKRTPNKSEKYVAAMTAFTMNDQAARGNALQHVMRGFARTSFHDKRSSYASQAAKVTSETTLT